MTARSTQLRGVIDKHLLRLAFRDPPKIEWRMVDAATHV